MAFGTQSVILSNGIQAGPSFALAQGLFVSVVSPATASSSASLRLTAGPPDQIEVGPSTTPHATVIGFGAVVPVGGNGNQVVIGTNATSGTDTQDDVVIGHGANAGVVVGGNGSVAIGVSATVGGAGANSGGGIAIGNTALANAGVAIGQGATCLLGQVAIGFNALARNFGVAIGDGTSAFFGGGHGNGSIAIGRSSSAGESTDVVIGTGNGGSAAGQGGNIFVGSGVGGTGVLSANCVVIGSSSNFGGVSNLPASAAVNANFSTVIGGNSQAQHAGVRLLGRGLVSTAANQTLIGGTDDPAATVIFGNGAVAAIPQNVIVGVTGGTGANATGASHTIAGGQSTGNVGGGSILFQTSPAGAAGAGVNALVTALTIDSTGLVTFANAPFLTTQSAPGAVVLTLTNGPAAAGAGNPQVYLQIKSTGHTYAIPAWAVS
jgi:hypothetical protein